MSSGLRVTTAAAFFEATGINVVDDTIETPKVITFVLLLTISLVHQIFNIQYSLVFKYICLTKSTFFLFSFF